MPTCNICKYAGRPTYKSPCSECKEFSKYEYENKKTNADIVTVQEQDGCDYCQLFDDPCGVPMIAQEESESDRGIYLYNGFLCANGGEFCEARVNFCPMCGRRFPQPPKGE